VCCRVRGGSRAPVPGPAPAGYYQGGGLMGLPTVTSIRLYPKGAIQVDAALRLTGDSWIACHIYTDNPPILSFEDEHVSVTVSARDPKHVTADDVAQAHRLADALARYIAELEKHVTAPGESEGVAA